MDLEGMGNVPSADDAEIKNLQQQGWDVETANADEDQRNQLEESLINGGYEVQVFLNPDNKTYTIMRKAPYEEAYTEDPAAAATEEQGYESISGDERDKLKEVFPGMFGDPEDEGDQRAA